MRPLIDSEAYSSHANEDHHFVRGCPLADPGPPHCDRAMKSRKSSQPAVLRIHYDSSTAMTSIPL